MPGDLTDDKYCLDSHDKLAADRFPKLKEVSNRFPKIKDDFSQPPPEPEKDVSKEVENFYQLHKEMVNADVRPKTTGSTKERLLSPILAAISNFNLAKRLHKENLEHRPLPDTIGDCMYRKLQMQRDQEPGLGLEEGMCATGNYIFIYLLPILYIPPLLDCDKFNQRNTKWIGFSSLKFNWWSPKQRFK